MSSKAPTRLHMLCKEMHWLLAHFYHTPIMLNGPYLETFKMDFHYFSLNLSLDEHCFHPYITKQDMLYPANITYHLLKGSQLILTGLVLSLGLLVSKSPVGGYKLVARLQFLTQTHARF